MTCQEYLSLLEKQLDGLATAEEAARMQKHEEACDSCRRQRELLTAIPEDLAALGQDVFPMPEDFHARWTAQLEEAPMPKKNRRVSWSRVLSAAAALVFVLGGALYAKDELDLTAGIPRPAAMEDNYGYTAGSAGGYTLARSAPSMEGDVLNDTFTDYDEAVEEESTVSAKKIIRTASLTIQTPAFDESLQHVRQMCEDMGGWISSLSESSGGTRRTASMTMRVPSAQLDLFLEGLGGAGRITRRNESADDVTETYQDTQARLDTQLALMERLRALVTTAGDLSDLLALESQIADTQYQIDRLQSALHHTDRQVDFATVDLSIREELPSDTFTEPERTLLQRLSDALQVGAESFLAFLEETAVFLVAALPFAGVVAALWIAVHFIRKAIKKHKE